jgi:holliday junction DNA helicase RuvA
VIGFLEGRVALLAADSCYLDVGGVGYKVMCPTTTLGRLPEVGEAFRLFTHLHVREDALALYGFATDAERVMFDALLGVSGVGPKVALAVCSAFAPDAFRRALVTDDVEGLASVPGLGKKTASRIVLDLKEKLQLPDLEIVGVRPDTLAQARSALQNLGYSPAEVRVAMSRVEAHGASVEEVIKEALRVLAG